MDLSALIFAALKKANTANERIDNLPLPMVFKGTLGTGGTISTLPTASSENEGFVYIVITDGTYSGQSAKAGDTFVSDGSSWVLVPSADEPSPIDDSVTSTALTWSSKKISDECKVKSFSYTGNGETTNVIKFSTTPHMIVGICGRVGSTYYGYSSHYFCDNSIPFLIMQSAQVGDTTIGGYVVGASMTADDELTLTANSAARCFNLDNVVYTVYYI